MTADRLTDRELQSLRNMGGLAEQAADEIAADRAQASPVVKDSLTTQAPAEGDERAAFEAWAGERGGNITRHHEGGERYASATVQGWWRAWQARAARSQSLPDVQPKGIPPARDMDAATTDAAIHYTAGWNACREAMAQAPAVGPVTWTDAAIMGLLNAVGDGPFGEEDITTTRRFMERAEEIRAELAEAKPPVQGTEL